MSAEKEFWFARRFPSVSAAPTVAEALAPLLGPEVTEGSSVSLSVRETGDEAEGWYPTNAYRRLQCARGGAPGQWTTGLCP